MARQAHVHRIAQLARSVPVAMSGTRPAFMSPNWIVSGFSRYVLEELVPRQNAGVDVLRHFGLSLAKWASLPIIYRSPALGSVGILNLTI